jgi:hypothetical protein
MILPRFVVMPPYNVFMTTRSCIKSGGGDEWRLRKINPAPILPHVVYLNINVLMGNVGTREARAANSRTPLWAKRFAVKPLAKLVLGLNIV